MEKVWAMNPEALFKVNRYDDTPFTIAVRDSHQHMIDQFQWKFSLEQLETVFSKMKHKREELRIAVELHCRGPLSAVLSVDALVHIVCEYFLTF